MAPAEEWPGGLAISVFDNIRKGVFDTRSDSYLQLAVPFFGMNSDGVAVNEGPRQIFWNRGMMGSVLGRYFYIHEFSDIAYTEDLRKVHVPTLVIHGGDDRIVPKAEFNIYEGAPHGLASTHQDRLNRALPAFARA